MPFPIVGEHTLKMMAEQLADDIEDRSRELEMEHRDILEKISQSKDALERARNFKPMLGSELQCLECFVDRNLQSPIRLQRRREEQVFHCAKCGQIYPPEARRPRQHRP
jgi:hemerythrin superfamily protein